VASVDFRDATRIYPGAAVPAVDRLNLEIGDGELMVLVGPSGCGKSTSLRMLAGLEEVSSGTIHIGDRDITHVPPKDRDIAMVFQNYALYPHMTVGENMGFALKMSGVPETEKQRRVHEAASLLGLDDFLDRKPKALSGGQRQRVAMGRAIVREPQVFLMDEPLSNLDAKLRASTRTQIAALQARLGITTVSRTIRESRPCWLRPSRPRRRAAGRALVQLTVGEEVVSPPAAGKGAHRAGRVRLHLRARQGEGSADRSRRRLRLQRPDDHARPSGR
jgi:ABC-type sugar transport system ATPase subunit